MIAALAAVSCIKDDYSFSLSKNEGALELSSMSMKLEPATEITPGRASEIDTKTFIVSIYDSENALSGSWTYALLPERITLPVGSYTLRVVSGEVSDAAWDAPCYGAEKTFAIEKDKTTALGTVTCSLINIMVSVSYDETMLSKLSEDSKVVVTVGSGQLEFAKGETRIGYFKAAAVENTLTAEFSGKIDGVYYAETDVIENVQAGQYRKLKYSVKENPDPDKPEGGADFKFSVDLTHETIDINKNIDLTEDVIPDPDEDKKPEEDKGKPTIQWVGGDIDKQYTVTTTDTTEVKIPIRIDAPNGITGFTVDIESTASAFSKESLNDLGLDTHMDFIEPGEMKSGLESLGFPTGDDVRGKTYLPFNITTFVPLFVVANNETVNFTLTITDALGNTEAKTLMLKIEL